MSRSVIDVMSDHRSVRDYRPVPLNHERLEAAVRAAQMASTSSHVQAYCVINVTESETRRQLAEMAGGQRQVAEAGAFLVICADIHRHQLISRRADSPHVQSMESFIVAVTDAALFAQNLALALESEGLGICYIGGLRNDLDGVDALLDLPDGVLPLFGLCAGEAASVPDRKPRLPLEAVLFDDTYPTENGMLVHVDAYDEQMRAYYEARGVPGRDWSRGILAKHAKIARESLARYYRRKGARFE